MSGGSEHVLLVALSSGDSAARQIHRFGTMYVRRAHSYGYAVHVETTSQDH